RHRLRGRAQRWPGVPGRTRPDGCPVPRGQRRVHRAVVRTGHLRHLRDAGQGRHPGPSRQLSQRRGTGIQSPVHALLFARPHGAAGARPGSVADPGRGLRWPRPPPGPPASMDLRQITYFIHVAELGSFTRASVVLDVAQPALSRQVRLLELELGQPLLVRNGRGVTPTEAVALLLERGRGILHQFDNLREELAQLGGGTRGNIALGMPPTVSKVLAVPLVRAVRRHLPGVTLSLSEGLSTTMLQSLAAGQLDLALVYDGPAQPGIATEAVFEEPLMLFSRRRAGAQAPPVPLAALAGLPLVIPRRPHTLRVLVEDALARLGLK